MERQVAELVIDTIISDLTDRRGIRHQWDQIDDDIRAEIRQQWMDIAEREDDPGKAVSAIVRDLSDRKGLDHAWDDIDDDIRAEIETIWKTIFERKDEVAKAVQDQLPAELERGKSIFKSDPLDETELREYAVSGILRSIVVKIARELEEEQE